MLQRTFEILRVFGVSVRIDLSWLLIAMLVTIMVGSQVFPVVLENYPAGVYWALAACLTLAIYLCVVVHELAHALIARRYSIRIQTITLYLFGGSAETEDPTPHPEAECAVALAGPLVSLVLSFAAGATWLLGERVGFTAPVSLLVFSLALANFALFLFNLLPAFPLDGGHLLHSILWSWRRDENWATAATSRVGMAFGTGFLIFAALILLQGSILTAVWLGLIGLFARQSSKLSFEQVMLRTVLHGEPVSRFVNREPRSVQRNLTVRELVQSWIYRYRLPSFPVVDGERLVGRVRVATIQQLPPEEWERQTVGAVTDAPDEKNTVEPEEDAYAAFLRLQRDPENHLLVAVGDHLEGTLALSDLLEFVALKRRLEPPSLQPGSRS